MEDSERLGRIICIVHGYTVAEVLRDHGEGVELAGFRVFGKGMTAGDLFQTAEDAARAIDERLGEAGG